MRGIMGESTGRKEDGFVLVWALLLMVVLLILGVSGIGTSVFESMMTANDALHKQSFFQADGGVNVAARLIEENVACSGGFGANSGANCLVKGNILVEKNANVGTGKLDLYSNMKTGSAATNKAGVPSEDPLSPLFRDAYYFYDGVNDPGGTLLPRTNIKTGATVVPVAGGSAGMIMGYAGWGYSAPGGGGARDYDIFSQHINVRQSQSVVEAVWRHLVGSEGACKYP
jgi:hypothetical protein